MISLAIAAAALFVARSVIKPFSPRPRIGERISARGLRNRVIELAKRCVSVERGSGLSVGLTYAIKREYKRLAKLGEFVAAQAVFARNAQLVCGMSDEVREALGKSHLLPHVGSRPRIFILCEQIVSSTRGNIDGELVKECVSDFHYRAPLTGGELAFVPHMLGFCVLGLIAVALADINAKESIYARGVRDGESGKLDLDALEYPDYVCGLMHGVRDGDKTFVQKITDGNGVDIAEAERARHARLAEMYAIAVDCVNALNVVASLDENYYPRLLGKDEKNADDRSLINKFKRSPYSAILPSTVIVIIAVVICFTVPARFAALFPVFATLVYIVFRPVISLPSLPLFEKKKRYYIEVPPQDESKVVYFGGEPDYKHSEIIGAATVSTDNRGNVFLCDGKSRTGIAPVFSSCGESAPLCAFDGVFERHRTVYRTVTANAEFAAEFFAPIDMRGCGIRFYVVNRTDHKIDSRLSVKTSGVKNNVLCGEGFDADGTYSAELLPYERRECVLYVLFCDEATRKRLPYATDGRYFSSELNETLVYSVDGGFIGSSEYDFGHGGIKRRSAPLACDTELPPEKPTVNTSFGGYTENGVIVTRSLFPKTLTDGGYTTKIYPDGDCENINDLYGKYDLIELPPVFVTLGEGDIIWSPSKLPLGRGNMRTKLHRGHVEYQCGYNECVCTLKRYVARSGRGEVFDLTVKNVSERMRKIDVMFSALAPHAVDVEFSDNYAKALKSDGDVLFYLCSSEKTVEFCKYAEGYFCRGEIMLTSGFRNGGTSVAPTLSSKIALKSGQIRRVVFSVSQSRTAVDERAADEYLKETEEFYEATTRVRAKTVDSALNFAYMHIQNDVINGYLSDEGDIVLRNYTALYFDTSKVKRDIAEMCRAQHANGGFGKESSFEKISALPLIVGKYVDCTHDYAALGEYLPFADEEDRVSVLEHCLRAVERLSELIEGGESAYEGAIVRAVAKRYVRYCPRSERKNRYIAAIKAADGMIGGAVKKCSEDPLSCIVCVILGAFGKNSQFDAVDIIGAVLADEKYSEETELKLLYIWALYRAGESERAFELLSPLYFRGKIAECGITAKRLFFLIVTEQLFGITLSGDKLGLEPVIDESTPKLGFEVKTKGGVCEVSVEGGSEGSRYMRCGRTVYAKSSVEADFYGAITIFRGGKFS